MNIDRLTPALILAAVPLLGCQQQPDRPVVSPADAEAEAEAEPVDAVPDIETDVAELDEVPTTVAPPVVYTDIEVFIDPTLQDACGITQPKLYFEFDSAEVMNEGDRTMELLAACLNDHPLGGDPLSITGYADPRGTEEYNRSLGLDRAKAVARVLTSNGVSADRIDTYSWGEEKASDDPDDWSTDRKVVVKLDR